ncbi:hypothetical protein A3G67_03470 [Candidatus Roizmanbacteria bacterium RIFCSPLOWO2_12_FULL_40_12]|uniref:Orn/DAP/Arg decarboxylase 2 N-terminal domain-containing protein n=1 Tax=Candidatus Roizmanbacteria bacterium RIFCSPLOWO2_01_FULL_40_42 TaxID=1802066 RepID=A0A1F7J5J9_9BACT|nr:MAG: hypothetical protein A2779_03105 [Candidatus Roizmanbacteria bacterium RIFCSPHIGHO2_01_FULL_40_98]OGK28330.1 MAG: hypothetical protein A3C31_00470 [Candidatus Roizmanbacteria bacterium RIFCSPHIGHO2_02_FULL_40_53]OGK30566.1 MAG: hypothetical protein A2W49_03155 [Candidatus Roizmanbacteria bacterium RIFCSPHIGHO2_12_41_18]OGK36980.1 MAG: hypothetical protein A3E69_00730 [Candidatus Roizmanbacteria bacterium RIFCSPHIGHO2_12_FULL_40_130]OGK50886.1 MAG: hypothetical protein A3B50_01240 [Candi
MLAKDLQKVERNIAAILNSKKKIPVFNPRPLVRNVLKKRARILKTVKKHKTPFFLYDKTELIKSIDDFREIFKKHVPSSEIYYAMKANPHEFILKDVVRNGLGIDASSGHELQKALKIGAERILFTGPGKTIDELMIALKHNRKVVLNIDSTGEIRKLKSLIKKIKKKLQVGIRISTSDHGKWTKFGIPLHELSSIWKDLKKDDFLQPEGIQAHMSWNETAEPYKNIISTIARYLDDHKELKREIKFIDLGGGFLPQKIEGLHSWSLVKGQIAKIAAEEVGETSTLTRKHFLSKAIPLSKYASEIGSAIKKHLSDLGCTYYFEPGRIICNNAMHIVLRVEDVKNPHAVIADGGTNMIGWERFEEEYFPVVNITQPSLQEKEVVIYGSLCTPHDIWGYFYHGKKIIEKDILVIPNQGAYTYTYAQNFIKPIPQVFAL